MKKINLMYLSAIGIAGLIGGPLFAEKGNFQQSKADYCQVGAPNFNPFAKRIALKIKNAENNLNYFYSNIHNNGQNRWYLHKLGPEKQTWDWTWINATTNDCIEFEEMLSPTQYAFTVIVSMLNSKDESVYLDTFVAFSNTDKNPNWNDYIWLKNVSNIPVTSFDGFNWHAVIDFHTK